MTADDRWGFDAWAETYDADVRDAEGPFRFTFRDYERVLDTVAAACGLDPIPGARVLDIGIGTGNLAGRLLARGAMVTGLEPSPEMRERCRRKFPDLPVVPGHFLSIPLAPRSFDVVVSTYAFHHLTPEEKERAVAGIRPLLRPGGRVLIADLMFRNPAARARIERDYVRRGEASVPEDYADEYPACVDDLAQTFTAAGFAFRSEQLTEAVWLVRGSL